MTQSDRAQLSELALDLAFYILCVTLGCVNHSFLKSQFAVAHSVSIRYLLQEPPQNQIPEKPAHYLKLYSYLYVTHRVSSLDFQSLTDGTKHSRLLLDIVIRYCLEKGKKRICSNVTFPKYFQPQMLSPQ